MRRYRRLATGIAMVTALLVMGVPAASADEADASDPAKDAQTDRPHPLGVETVVTTLPVLGSQLTVTVTMGDSGVIESVALDRDATAVREGEHRVVYELTEGTFVLVKAGAHRVTTKVRSDNVDDASGPGTWTADVFGNGNVVITYAVGTDDAGNPTVSVESVTPPPGVEADLGEPKSRSSERRAKAKQVVMLTSGEEAVRVVFAVSLKVNRDGTSKVSLAVSVGNWRGHWANHRRSKDDRRDGDHAWSRKRRNTRASKDGGKQARRDTRDERRDRPDGRDDRRDRDSRKRPHDKSDG